MEKISSDVFCLFVIVFSLLLAGCLGWIFSLYTRLRVFRREEEYLLRELDRYRGEAQGKREAKSLATEEQWTRLWSFINLYHKGLFPDIYENPWERVNLEIVRIQDLHLSSEQVIGIRRIIVALAQGIHDTEVKNQKLSPVNKKITFNGEGGYTILEE